MKKALFLLLSACMCACSPIYYQVYSVKCTNCNPITAETPYFQSGQDSVYVQYYFWSENGTMMFAIVNEKSQPIYIDWKRCGFFRNGVKHEYWSDVQVVKTELVSATGPIFYVNGRPSWVSSVHSGTSVIKKNERITFVVSHSVLNKQPASYTLMPYHNLIVDDSLIIRKKVPLDGDSLTSYARYYEPNNSILKVRNFITWTLSESGQDGAMIDNSFYVVKVEEVPEKLFLNHPYGHSTRFYKPLRSTGYSIEDRSRGIFPYEY